jgi:hypothetical protein
VIKTYLPILAELATAAVLALGLLCGLILLACYGG